MAIGIIPARLGSSRLPRKALLEIEGRPLIAWVVENAARAASLEEIWVATDDAEIAAAAAAAGAKSAMTRADHPSGSDRIAEVARDLDHEIIVNIQGDEPEIAPSTIDSVADLLKNDPELDMATAAVPLTRAEDYLSTHRVKVVCDLRGRALYFSRSPIPHRRDDEAGLSPVMPTGDAAPLGHIGIYAYRKTALLEFVSRTPSPLEVCEALEQLRALQGGMKIGVAVVGDSPAGIDTAADLEAFQQRVRLRRGD